MNFARVGCKIRTACHRLILIARTTGAIGEDVKACCSKLHFNRTAGVCQRRALRHLVHQRTTKLCVRLAGANKRVIRQPTSEDHNGLVGLEGDRREGKDNGSLEQDLYTLHLESLVALVDDLNEFVF